MREIVKALVSDTTKKIELLCRAVEQADMLACRKLAHNAQGACGTAGAASMAALFRSIEIQAMDGLQFPITAAQAADFDDRIVHGVLRGVVFGPSPSPAVEAFCSK